MPGRQPPYPGDVPPVGLVDQLLGGAGVDQPAAGHHPIEGGIPKRQLVEIVVAGHPGQVEGGLPGHVEPGTRPVDDRPGPVHARHLQHGGPLDEPRLPPPDPAHQTLQADQLALDLIRGQFFKGNRSIHGPTVSTGCDKKRCVEAINIVHD
jgi:hypothetical protein